MHVNELPVEILQRIFETCALDPFHYEMQHVKELERTRSTLTSVCSWWRTVAVNHSILWRIVCFWYEYGIHPSLNTMRTHISRSRIKDLHVFVNITDQHGDSSSLSPLQRSVESFIGTLESEVPRISNFTIELPRRWDVGDSIFRAVIPRAPLTALKLETLAPGFNPYLKEYPQAFSRIDELTLKNMRMRRDDLQGIIRHLPQLRSLKLLTKTTARYCPLGQSIEPRVLAPTLESLELFDTVIPPAAFDAPRLKSLHYQPHLSIGEEANWWETNFHPILTKDHKEIIKEPIFPLLSSFAFDRPRCLDAAIEPSRAILSLHPTISEFRIIGEESAPYLFNQKPHTVKEINPPLPTCLPNMKRIVIDGRKHRRRVQDYETSRDIENLVLIIHYLLHTHAHLRIIWMQNATEGLPSISPDILGWYPALGQHCCSSQYLPSTCGPDRITIHYAQRILAKEFHGRFVVKCFTRG